MPALPSARKVATRRTLQANARSSHGTSVNPHKGSQILESVAFGRHIRGSPSVPSRRSSGNNARFAAGACVSRSGHMVP